MGSPMTTEKMLATAALLNLDDDAPWSAWADCWQESGKDPKMVWQTRSWARMMVQYQSLAKSVADAAANLGAKMAEAWQPVVAELRRAANAERRAARIGKRKRRAVYARSDRSRIE